MLMFYTDIWYQSQMPIGPMSVAPDLLADRVLTLGYGNGGVDPFQFSLAPNQDIDVTFFKVFLSNSPVSVQSFIQSVESCAVRAGQRSSWSDDHKEGNDWWATEIVTVLQHARNGEVRGTRTSSSQIKEAFTHINY